MNFRWLHFVSGCGIGLVQDGKITAQRNKFSGRRIEKIP
jgi:predicted NBD/HSP70 family sugar kinase